MYDKIFVIGFNKTGTSSIDKFLKKLGLNSIHTTTPVLEIIHDYDAFSDGIHSQFRLYYQHYPNSLFILNTRPLRSWLISRYKHAEFHDFKPCWCWPVSNEKTKSWITERVYFHREVMEFFQDKPSQLLIVNIENETWMKTIRLAITGKTVNETEIKENVRPSKRIPYINEIQNNISHVLSVMGYTGDEI
jgi:hypothetical protein